MSQGGRPSLLRPSLFMVDYHFAVVFGWLLVAAAMLAGHPARRRDARGLLGARGDGPAR